MKKIILAAVISLACSSVYAAPDQGHGKVTFTGSIIDAPCSITPESLDQTVEMGQISKAALIDGGKSTPRNFSINLENCDVSKKDNVKVTFSGMESSANNGLLGITGSASGASIAITSGDGQVIKLGEPTKAQRLVGINNTLSFAAYVQGDAADEDGNSTVTEGDFNAVAGFTLAYN